MRSRPHPAVFTKKPAPPPHRGNGLLPASLDDEEKKQQQPQRKSKFRLPPPPKLSFANNDNGQVANPCLENSEVTQSKLPAPPSLPIPSSQPQLFQRKQSSNSNPAAAAGENGDIDETTISIITSKRLSAINTITNPYQTYKPSTWYSNSRRTQKIQQCLQNAFIILVACISLGILGWNFHHLHKEEKQHRRHHNYHHHDRKQKLDDHNHLHAMIGIVDNPAGFALYSSPINEKQKRQSEPELFSRVPTIKLSNNRILPQVGFGVAGHHIEHKEIPLIVSRLLQYASSENEGGGGISIIDAVNEGVEKEDPETSMTKTVVALVGRAITFFTKENNRAINNNADVKKPNDNSYDYTNRLEIHVLISLTGSDLGKENTLKALDDLTKELDGLVPPIHDLNDLDATSWKANVVDRRVDTRLHVLLRLPECYNDIHRAVPCAIDESANLGSIQSWINSWGVLERLYEANIVHGIGIDGATEEDLTLLLKHCRITPQMYRGDVSQALDSYGRKMGVHSANEYLHVEGLLKNRNITFLASNVAGHVLEKKDHVPNAFSLMQMLGKILFHSHREMLSSQEGSLETIGESEEDYYSVPRLALAYLVRHGVIALPRAYKPEHLVDDSPEAVGGLADFLTDRRVAEIGTALKALVTGRDLDEEHGLGTEDEDAVAVVFHNEMGEDVEIVHHIARDSHYNGLGEIREGDSNVFTAMTGDTFEVYHRGHIIGKHKVAAKEGGADDFIISDTTLNH